MGFDQPVWYVKDDPVKSLERYCTELANFYNCLIAAEKYFSSTPQPKTLKEWLKPSTWAEWRNRKHALKSVGVSWVARVANSKNIGAVESNSLDEGRKKLLRRWLCRAKLALPIELKQERKLKWEHISNPEMLADILHAFDRSDETYFLYLVHQVTRIGEWMGRNKLLFDQPWNDGISEDRLPPWKKYRQGREDRKSEFITPEKFNQNQKKIRKLLNDLCHLELIAKIGPWKDAASQRKRSAKEEIFEQLVYDVLGTGARLAWARRADEDIKLAMGKVTAAKARLKAQGASPPENQPQEARAEVETLIRKLEIEVREAEEEEKQAELERKLLLGTGTPEEVQAKAKETNRRLTAALLVSPKNQSKLALLLGETPSRWLRKEEAAFVLARRQLHRAASNRAHETESTAQTATGNGIPDSDGDRAKQPTPFSGLCFSGGGIRSATFNLGILQALAELRLLEGFDYLSTVSGGGYIHQWLAAWLKRAARSKQSKQNKQSKQSDGPGGAFQTVNRALMAQPVSPLPGIEPTQISFLRRFSNYLTPQTGVFSADVWTLFAIWARNTFLNQLVLVSGFIWCFSLLRLFLSGAEYVSFQSEARRRFIWFLAFVLFVLATAYICVRVRVSARELDDEGLEGKGKGYGDTFVIWVVAGLLISAAAFTVRCLGAGSLFQFVDLAGLLKQANLSGLIFHVLLRRQLLAVFMIWPIAEAFSGFTPRQYRLTHGKALVLWRYLGFVLSSVLAGGAVFILLCSAHDVALTLWCDHILKSTNKAVVAILNRDPAVACDLALLFGPPTLVAALFLCSVLQVGLNGRVFRDEVLEWLARLRAWGFIASLTWFVFVGFLVVAAPFWKVLADSRWQGWRPIVGVLWAAISTGGAFAARSSGSSVSPSHTCCPTSSCITTRPTASTVRQLGIRALVKLSPYLFMAGVFLASANVAATVTPSKEGDSFSALCWLFVGSLAVFLLFGWTVDINEFSMFSFYRNRLARCYQGASVIDRQPDPFTGFSVDDRAISLKDLRLQLSDLDSSKAPWLGREGDAIGAAEEEDAYPGPFPIFCCTVNFTSGEDLAWQERKGASFAYTPLYSGYDIPWTGIDRDGDGGLFYNGFRDTLDLEQPNGPRLADVCAVSGAAASPNWGYHTSPASAFLMTCFNVRLGVWKRNTRHPMREGSANKPIAVNKQSPGFAPCRLFEELFGLTTARKEFLYLSDGGHFDNMGLYELVRRGCRYIVVCDAEEDGELKFEGIAMSLRKCRTDFGVAIDLDLRAMRREATSSWSGVHCVVGTILYPNEPPETPRRSRAKIVYIKSTLTGSEPADLLSYSLKNPHFPHDTTVDQFFSESQFESYRVLGRYIARTCFSPAIAKNSKAPLEKGCEEFFNSLYDIWYPVTPAIEQHIANHGARLDAIAQELRAKDGLAVLANQLFSADGKFSGTLSKKQTAYFRALALSLFDFTWRVYNDLDLQIEANRSHPHGEVWIETFKGWVRMDFMKDAWTDYAHRYPRSFCFFLEQHLNFDIKKESEETI